MRKIALLGITGRAGSRIAHRTAGARPRVTGIARQVDGVEPARG